MTARRRNARRKEMEGCGVHRSDERPKDLPGRDSCPESGSGPSPAGGAPKIRESLPVAVVLEIIAREYSGDAREDALCRAALRIAEESGQIEFYRARWDEEESAPAGIRSSLLFDRNQCLELINYYKSSGRMEKLQQEKAKLAQIEGRLLLGGGSPTRITNEDLNKLEEFLKESGF
ncbi:MAG TPA: hypothetical protein DCZ10_13790 [Pelotomaculum sp.]|nr:hypothetical protein [Pelotomaculum sp.]